MKVVEVFHAPQGEGVYQGVPMVFIRLAGCNLRPGCKYCDTTYAQSVDSGTEMSTEEIAAKVREFLPRYKGWTCVTGGEPLVQADDLKWLVAKLKQQGYSVEAETNGSLPVPDWYELVDSWCADIKCPSSGVLGASREKWCCLRAADQVKLVVGNEKDLEFAHTIIETYRDQSPTFLVSPVMKVGQEDWKNPWVQRVVEFAKEEHVRFSLQMHKVIFGDQRGV